MIIFLLRMLIFFAIIFFIYKAYRYIVNPKRKLEHALETKSYYFLDDTKNVKKKLLITYKGAMFEGEKQLGTTDKAFEVTTVNIRVHHEETLKGINKEDLTFLKEEILKKYPYANIIWQYPINKLLPDYE
ncbi:sigma-w pathway protein ysdB [Salirhabdus salicampi]|uniref:sigma-w pathway protein ysdB n=1 Tax=Salirhabdus salicampi TaxID=476102 RepID=UPI0020C4E830|nr:sigma-w pathway protein ysdB [Salirhabdus salicampi]MCP8617070.1 sigma-w pathway protein ysdB [Salirhabdus salicampi]